MCSYVCSVLGILFHCVVLCIVCVQKCTVLLPPGVNPIAVNKYRVIHKSLLDFRPLRYSSRDGHADGEHVDRGRETPSFRPTLQVLDMLILGVCLGCCAAEFGSSGGLMNYPVCHIIYQYNLYLNLYL